MDSFQVKVTTQEAKDRVVTGYYRRILEGVDDSSSSFSLMIRDFTFDIHASNSRISNHLRLSQRLKSLSVISRGNETIQTHRALILSSSVHRSIQQCFQSQNQFSTSNSLVIDAVNDESSTESYRYPLPKPSTRESIAARVAAYHQRRHRRLEEKSTQSRHTLRLQQTKLATLIGASLGESGDEVGDDEVHQVLDDLEQQSREILDKKKKKRKANTSSSRVNNTINKKSKKATAAENEIQSPLMILQLLERQLNELS